MIDNVISKIKKLGFDLTDEGDVDSFLGIQIDTEDNGTIHMTQPALISIIIKTLGLENDSRQH